MEEAWRSCALFVACVCLLVQGICIVGATSDGTAPATVTCAGSCACNASSDTRSGTISDGPADYQNSMECSWVIDANISSLAIILSFSSFETESYRDVVKIYDSASNELAALSGSSVSTSTKYSSTARMRVAFTSDSISTSSGFVAGWEIGCAGGYFFVRRRIITCDCHSDAGYHPLLNHLHPLPKGFATWPSMLPSNRNKQMHKTATGPGTGTQS